MFFDFVSFLDRRRAIAESRDEDTNLRSATCTPLQYIDVVVVLTLSYYSLLSSTFASLGGKFTYLSTFASTLAEHCSRMTSSTATYGTCIHV